MSDREGFQKSAYFYRRAVAEYSCYYISGMTTRHRLNCFCKTTCLTKALLADTITIGTDGETEYAPDVLTHDGSSRSAAIQPESAALRGWLDQRPETPWISSVLTRLNPSARWARHAPEAVSACLPCWINST